MECFLGTKNQTKGFSCISSLLAVPVGIYVQVIAPPLDGVLLEGGICDLFIWVPVVPNTVPGTQMLMKYRWNKCIRE